MTDTRLDFPEDDDAVDYPYNAITSDDMDDMDDDTESLDDTDDEPDPEYCDECGHELDMDGFCETCEGYRTYNGDGDDD